MKIILATHNDNKLKEFKELLKDTPYDCVSLTELGYTEAIEETGSTYRENALVKVRKIAQYYPQIIISDDSGFEVDALNYEPGVYSSRYLGEKTPDFVKNTAILERMKGVDDRSARFVCAMALKRGSFEWTCQGIVEGEVSDDIRGSGFGYDPIFIPRGLTQTFGEIDGVLKNTISHRGLALQQVLHFLNTHKQELSI